MDAKVEQIAAELSLSGSALMMWRGSVASIRSWKVGDLGPGAIELFPGDLDARRQHMLDNWESAARGWAEELLKTCRKGKDYPRNLTADRVYEAMLAAAE